MKANICKTMASKFVFAGKFCTGACLQQGLTVNKILSSRAGSASSKENHYTKQESKVVPATGIWEGVNFIVGKKAGNKTEKNDEAVQ